MQLRSLSQQRGGALTLFVCFLPTAAAKPTGTLPQQQPRGLPSHFFVTYLHMNFGRFLSAPAILLLPLPLAAQDF
jgi:hypothetical protein